MPVRAPRPRHWWTGSPPNVTARSQSGEGLCATIAGGHGLSHGYRKGAPSSMERVQGVGGRPSDGNTVVRRTYSACHLAPGWRARIGLQLLKPDGRAIEQDAAFGFRR